MTGPDHSLEKRFYSLPNSEVAIPDFPAEGLILDVGGGGEGVIGRIKGRQVVAIDRLKSELEEAPAGPLKIVMDATNLQFLDGSFDAVTLFYTLMFIPFERHAAVFSELFRVLRPGGRLWVWNPVMPAKPSDASDEQDISVFPFTFRLPAEIVQTAFGARWPAQTRGAQDELALAQASGFRLLELREEQRNFFCLLERP